MRAHIAAIVLAGCLMSCRSTGLTDRLQPPAFNPPGQTKCSVAKSQGSPLVVEWPSAERGALESALARGAVVVRYSGCEMDVLEDCRATGKYRYASFTTKQDRLVIRDQDELYASLPVGAPVLESRLKTAGQLDVDMTLVGRFELERAVDAMDLQGNCVGATHAVSAATVGAFTFSAGAQVDAAVGVIGLGGGKTTGVRETLTRDGDPVACQSAEPKAGGPPDRCGAVVRLEVSRIAGRGAPNESPPATAQPQHGLPTSTYLLAGLGIIGLGVGAGYGMRATSLASQADGYCDGRACRDQKGIDLRNDANASATVSTISVGVGLAAIGAAVWTGLSPRDASKERERSVRTSPHVMVGLGSVEVGGRW